MHQHRQIIFPGLVIYCAPHAAPYPLPMKATTIRAAIEHSIEQYYAMLEEDEHPREASGLYHLIIHEAEHAVISHIMLRCEHNQSQAAKILGITRNTLKKKLDEHRIPYPKLK